MVAFPGTFIYSFWTLMDTKLIEKLARLANNNPNEHEANLAARKVCKLLEAGKYQFNDPTIPNPFPPKQPQNPPNPFTGTPFEDMFSGRWSGFDFDKGTNKEWNFYTAKSNKERWTVKETEEPKKSTTDSANYQRAEYESSSEDEWIWNPVKDYYINVKTGEKVTRLQRESDHRKKYKVKYYKICQKCKLAKPTFYTGPEINFVCTECDFKNESNTKR